MSEFYEIFKSSFIILLPSLFVIVALIIFYERRLNYYKQKEKRRKEEIIYEIMMNELSTLISETNIKLRDKYKEWDPPAPLLKDLL